MKYEKILKKFKILFVSLMVSYMIVSLILLVQIQKNIYENENKEIELNSLYYLKKDNFLNETLL